MIGAEYDIEVASGTDLELPFECTIGEPAEVLVLTGYTFYFEVRAEAQTTTTLLAVSSAAPTADASITLNEALGTGTLFVSRSALATLGFGEKWWTMQFADPGGKRLPMYRGKFTVPH